MSDIVVEDVPFHQKKVCCCEMRTFLVMLNCLCGVGMMIFGIFNIFAWVGFNDQIVLNFGFYFYQIFFGFIIACSFCDFKFLWENFAFIKTTSGKGWFDLFCCSMFLVTTSDKGVTGFIFTGLLGGCGIFFVILSCFVKEEIKDTDSKQLSKDLTKSAGTKLLEANTAS